MQTTSEQGPDQLTAPRGRRRRGGGRRGPLALVAVLLLSGLVVGLHIDTYRQMSVYDEVQHVDYVNRLLEGSIPASGDRWLPRTIDEVTCRTIDYPAPFPACGVRSGYDTLPNQAYTTAFIHAPLYYGVAAGAVLVAGWSPWTVDDVDAMRGTGFLWLAAALVLLWVLWREVGVSRPVRIGLSLALVATPSVLLAQSTVTNDATSLAAGAAVTVATLRWDRGACRLWVPAALALLAVLLKATSLAVLLMACAYVLIRCLQRNDTLLERRHGLVSPRILSFIGSLAAATVVVGVGWTAISRARATLDEELIPQNLTLMAGQFDLSWLTTSLQAMVSPLQPQFYQSALLGTAATSVANLANVGLIALCVVAAVRSEPRSVVRALAIAVAAAALAFGPLLTVINYVSLGVQFGIPARYGLSLVPAMLAVAGTAVRTRRGGVALVAAGLLLYAAITCRLLA